MAVAVCIQLLMVVVAFIFWFRAAPWTNTGRDEVARQRVVSVLPRHKLDSNAAHASNFGARPLSDCVFDLRHLLQRDGVGNAEFKIHQVVLTGLDALDVSDLYIRAVLDPGQAFGFVASQGFCG